MPSADQILCGRGCQPRHSTHAARQAIDDIDGALEGFGQPAGDQRLERGSGHARVLQAEQRQQQGRRSRPTARSTSAARRRPSSAATSPRRTTAAAAPSPRQRRIRLRASKYGTRRRRSTRTVRTCCAVIRSTRTRAGTASGRCPPRFACPAWPSIAHRRWQRESPPARSGARPS